jgi:multiple sugar transport system ATP-binding protein
MSDPFLAVRGVSKRFGSVTALSEIDLTVGPDELLVVVGPTRAGKTTLLRVIAGLERPDSGTIEMNGADVSDASPAARDVALVFQNFSLYPQWSVKKNIEFPLRAPGRGLTEEQIQRQVAFVAGLLKIEHLLDRKSTRLSGGEMQRVAIGRAIARKPRLFLMDEPLTNLDAKLREALRVELVELRRKLGTPMIFVTHNQAEALSMGDRVVVLSEGRVLQDATPQEIYRKPRSPAVARQLGQPRINVFFVHASDGFLRTGSGVPLLPLRPDTPKHPLVLGVRPEDIALEGGSHPGTVELLENMGPAKIAVVAWAGEHVHVLVPKSAPLKQGDRVYPRFDPDRAVLWPVTEREDVASTEGIH